MNVPNWLTLLRIFLIPVFALIFYLPFAWSHAASALIFALAGFTDWLDGYLARKLQQTSELGTFLDPVADKLVVTIALVMLVGQKHFAYLALPSAIIIGREIVISALREWMAELGKRTSVAVSYIGKLKTAIQLFAIFLLVLHNPQNPHYIKTIGYILIYSATGLTLWSMVMYLKAAWADICPSKNQ